MQDGSDPTWEPPINLSEDVVRDYEEAWWTAAKKAEIEPMAKMLGGATKALSMIVDENGRRCAQAASTHSVHEAAAS